MIAGLFDDIDRPPLYRGVSEPRVTISREPELTADAVPVEELRAVTLRICGDNAEATRVAHAIVPKSSLNRRGTLTLAQGEQTLRLGRLFDMAMLAFLDEGDAREFMRRPHPELKGRRPIDAAMTEMGGRAVEQVLDCMIYGLPA